MKKGSSFLLIIFVIASCGKSETSSLEQMYQDSISLLMSQLELANATIEQLKYPANQRLSKAKSLVDAGELDKAIMEIEQLRDLFPHSDEAAQSQALIEQIDIINEEKKSEEERLRALGFKTIPERTKIIIDHNTIVLSNIKIGNTYSFDAYGGKCHSLRADRDSKFVTMDMAVTSTIKYPQLPQFAIYSISGDTMIFQSWFYARYAKWRDEEAYNKIDDDSNNFAKVSTVRFKLGCQIDNETLSKPYAIVLKKTNELFRTHDSRSFDWLVNYPKTLSLDDFKDLYVIIKRFNL